MSICLSKCRLIFPSPMTSASIISLNIPGHGRLKPIHEPASLQTASQSASIADREPPDRLAGPPLTADHAFHRNHMLMPPSRRPCRPASRQAGKVPTTARYPGRRSPMHLRPPHSAHRQPSSHVPAHRLECPVLPLRQPGWLRPIGSAHGARRALLRTVIVLMFERALGQA